MADAQAYRVVRGDGTEWGRSTLNGSLALAENLAERYEENVRVYEGPEDKMVGIAIWKKGKVDVLSTRDRTLSPEAADVGFVR